MKIYLASSWRNERQPEIVKLLRENGHEVYDFRNPEEGDDGFSWREIDDDWQNWTPEKFRAMLEHPASVRGFKHDYDAMKWADCCVLLMPCGRSAHLEAGYFWGADKPLHILLASGEPELMYKGATSINVNTDELLRQLSYGDMDKAYPPDPRAEPIHALLDGVTAQTKIENQAKGQLTLRELIAQLEQRPATDKVRIGAAMWKFSALGSYRGYYEQLAIEYTSDAEHEDTTVEKLLEQLQGMIGSTVEGYKGGLFKITPATPVWASNYGECSSLAVQGVSGGGEGYTAIHLVLIE